ncbi:response regulator transcription factor, partial [Escherichia coli]|nr:response regulator transcription factor [Escherichia coli]
MKLLLLEDDTETRVHIVRLLEAEGHVVDTARTGPD